MGMRVCWRLGGDKYGDFRFREMKDREGVDRGARSDGHPCPEYDPQNSTAGEWSCVHCNGPSSLHIRISLHQAQLQVLGLRNGR